uniref:uncharacterized protein isoform X1 n=1 Tax=Pristiophorus japonicus TaxID=55135 RepID=UPI00398E8A9C
MALLHPENPTMTPTIRDCLVHALEDLGQNDLKSFIHKLCEYKLANLDPIGYGCLEGKIVWEIIDMIIRHYSEEIAGKVTVDVLTAIQQRNTADKLSTDLVNIQPDENDAADEVNAPASKKMKYSEDKASSTRGLWTLPAMERHAKENMDKLYISLRDKIGAEEMKTIEAGVWGRKMKASFSITAKGAHDIVSNKMFKTFRSQATGSFKSFPWNLAANYLFEGVRDQRAGEGHRSDADVGGAPVDVTMDNESEKESSATFVQISLPNEDSLDVSENKGIDNDNDIKLPGEDSGFEANLSADDLTQIKDGEEEEGNDRGDFKTFCSQAKGYFNSSPVNTAANDLLQGMAPRGQRTSEGQRSVAYAGGSPVDVTMDNESKKEPSSILVDSLMDRTGVDLRKVQISGLTEDSVDVAEDKGIDNKKDIKLPRRDSGFGPNLSADDLTQIKDGEEEEGNDRGESLSQSPPQVTSSATSEAASRLANSVMSQGPPSRARTIAKRPRRKDVWTVEEEIKAKRAAMKQWVQEQVDQILRDGDSRSREEVMNELEASLEQVHIGEHPECSALRARNCLACTVQKVKVAVFLQLPTKPGGNTFASRMKSGGLKKVHLSCVQYNMGVLGGISRTDAVFYSQGRADIHKYDYNENEFNSIRTTLEGFITEAVLPLLAVYFREQRKLGVFLEAQG